MAQRECALVQGLTDDRALDAEPAQRGDVGQGVDTTRGDNTRIGRIRDARQQFQVCSPHLAVSGHVGDDKAGDPGLVERAEDLPDVAPLTRGAPRRETLSAHIETDRDARAECVDGIPHGVKVVQRLGCDVDPIGSRLEGGLHVAAAHDSARELDGHVDLVHHAGEQLIVVATSEGAIQIHQVHPARSGFLEGAGDLRRVRPGSIIDDAGGEADGPPTRHVDRGQ